MQKRNRPEGGRQARKRAETGGVAGGRETAQIPATVMQWSRPPDSCLAWAQHGPGPSVDQPQEEQREQLSAQVPASAMLWERPWKQLPVLGPAPALQWARPSEQEPALGPASDQPKGLLRWRKAVLIPASARRRARPLEQLPGMGPATAVQWARSPGQQLPWAKRPTSRRRCCGRGRPGPSDGAAVGAAVGTAACPEPSVGEAVGAGAGAASLGRSSDQPKELLGVAAIIVVVSVVVAD